MKIGVSEAPTVERAGCLACCTAPVHVIDRHNTCHFWVMSSPGSLLLSMPPPPSDRHWPGSLDVLLEASPPASAGADQVRVSPSPGPLSARFGAHAMSATHLWPFRRVHICQVSAPEVIGFPESFSQIRAHLPNDALVRNEIRVIAHHTIPNY
jgi:hypothetical protein